VKPAFVRTFETFGSWYLLVYEFSSVLSVLLFGEKHGASKRRINWANNITLYLHFIYTAAGNIFRSAGEISAVTCSKTYRDTKFAKATDWDAVPSMQLLSAMVNLLQHVVVVLH